MNEEEVNTETLDTWLQDERWGVPVGADNRCIFSLGNEHGLLVG
jgi:hypothetical protein